MPTRPRVVLHADMDAFYAAIEQRDRPELRGKPVIVGGTGDRGVVSTASYEARRFGVHSAMPSVEARRLCPEGIFLRGEMRRYVRESRRIFEIFHRYTPRLQGLSLDEAFLDLSGTERLLGPAAEVGKNLREEVRQCTGLAVSVGIAPVKLVAKIASDLAKPDGLLEVKAEAVAEVMAPLPVSRIWGVGAVGQARLEAAGFRWMEDLVACDPDRVVSLLGSWGADVARLARGEDLGEVEPYREPVSYSEENTFGSNVSDRRQLEATILAHAESVARRLRTDRVKARTVVLKLKLGRRRSRGPRGYPLLTRRTTLAVPTDDGDEIARTARELLVRAKLRESIRLLGVGVTNLGPAADAQLSLFEARGPRARRTRLNHALDEIADRFGSRAVVRGGVASPDRAGLSMQIKRGGPSDSVQ